MRRKLTASTCLVISTLEQSKTISLLQRVDLDGDGAIRFNEFRIALAPWLFQVHLDRSHPPPKAMVEYIAHRAASDQGVLAFNDVGCGQTRHESSVVMVACDESVCAEGGRCCES